MHVFPRLTTMAICAQLFSFCAIAQVPARVCTVTEALKIADKLQTEGVLNEAGKDLLKSRICETASDGKGCRHVDSPRLRRMICGPKEQDTVFDISNVSILTFIWERLAGELYYRGAYREERELAKSLGIYRTPLPDPETDSAAFSDQMRKLGTIAKLNHPGKSIEAAIAWEDRPLPGWFTFVIPEEQSSDYEALGHGYIAASLSVIGKTRTRLATTLRELNLIDRETADHLIRRIRKNIDVLEVEVVRNAVCPQRRGQDVKTTIERIR